MTKQLIVVAVVAASIGGACTSPDTAASEVATAWTIATNGPATTVQPTTSAVIGQPCDEPGRIGLNTEGQQLLCSGTSLTGQVLAVPAWRDAVARDLGSDPAFTVAEQDAIDLALSVEPLLAGTGDHALLVFLYEYAGTMELAADSGIGPDEAFIRLVEGHAAQNGFTMEKSLGITLGMVAGAAILLEPNSPARNYTMDMLDWATDPIDS